MKTKIPEYITKSYDDFSNEISRSESFLTLIHIGSEFTTNNKNEVKDKLIKLYSSYRNEQSENMVNLIKNNKTDNFLDLKSYELFYSQMCYARSFDNLLIYFKDILSEIILKQPNILKSKETERLDFILKYDSIEELQTAIAEKKIKELFYAGIDKIESYFKERLNIDLFKSKEDKNDFNQALKNRNLIVHNRGVISKEYLKEFPNAPMIEGETIVFTFKDISTVNLVLLGFTVNLDKELSTKFKLETIKY